jgi:hypothetical protein
MEETPEIKVVQISRDDKVLAAAQRQQAQLVRQRLLPPFLMQLACTLKDSR